MEEIVMTDKLEAEEAAKLEADKAAKKKEAKKLKAKKATILSTYFITVLCLLAGLLVPLFRSGTSFDGEPIKPVQMMLLKYIPLMINYVTSFVIKKEFVPTEKLPAWFEREVPAGTDTFLSFICVLYALVCVIALLMFIPVCLGSKKKNTSANSALAVEILTLLLTITYIAYNTYFMVKSGNTENIKWHDYNFFIPFGGALLMAIAQTVSSKGSIGVSKVIAVLLSAIGVVALCDLTLFIPSLKTPLSQFSNKVHCGEQIGFLFGLENPAGSKTILGIDGLNILLTIKTSWGSFISTPGSNGKPDVFKIIIYILLIAVSLFTLLNLVIDIIGLGTSKKFKKGVPCANSGSNTFALVRYILTLIVAAAIICLEMFVPSLKEAGVKVGIYLYVLVAILFISLINAIIRTACANARVRKYNAANKQPEPAQSVIIQDPAFVAAPETAVAEAQPVYQQPVYQPAEEYVAEPEYVPADYSPMLDSEPLPVAEPLSAPLEEPAEPAEPTPIYYYGGDTDEFMDTLTDNEKVEFVEMFVKRSKGEVKGVPAYSINADNSDFFPAVFIHINRYRNIVSDALMTKMYKQLGKGV